MTDIKKTRGRPRKARTVDLKLLTGPELRNIIALMTDAYSASDAYSMLHDDLLKAIVANEGQYFKDVDLSGLNPAAFRDPAIMNYVLELQSYVHGTLATRPTAPTAQALDYDSLVAPSALKAYREAQKQAKLDSKEDKVVHLVVPNDEAPIVSDVRIAELPPGAMEAMMKAATVTPPNGVDEQATGVMAEDTSELETHMALLVQGMETTNRALAEVPGLLIRHAETSQGSIALLIDHVNSLNGRLTKVENALLLLVNAQLGLKKHPIMDLSTLPAQI
mgnify:CR=1 FL=1